MITENEKLNKGINWWIIITLITQLVWFVRMIAMLESRVKNLEDRKNEWDRFTAQDGKILEQKIEFYTQVVVEMKADLKEIKNELKRF